MKRRDYSQILIFAALFVTTARYIGAFLASDLGKIEGGLSQVITILMGFTGLGMGILDVLGGAYIFDGWRRGMPKAGQKWSFRFRVSTFFVFALFGVGIVILVPFTVSRVSRYSMSEVLGIGYLLWVWSLSVNIAPYLLIGGVVAGQSGVISITSQEKPVAIEGNLPENMSENKSRVMENYSQDWRRLSYDARISITRMTTAEVVQAYGVSERTARNWRKAARKYSTEG